MHAKVIESLTLQHSGQGDRIETLYRQSREMYGRPGIHADLRDEHIRIGFGVDGVVRSSSNP